jgi:HPt (histidine-containing phosphotransfer) domain-containing protein
MFIQVRDATIRQLEGTVEERTTGPQARKARIGSSTLPPRNAGTATGHTNRILAAPTMLSSTVMLPNPPDTAPESAPGAAGRERLGSANVPALVPDWSLLEELSFGKESFIVQVVATFLREAPPLLLRIERAAREGDMAALAQTLHKLRGQTAYFCVPELQDELNALEQQAQHSASGFAAGGAVALIRQQMNALYPALRERLCRARQQR